MRFLLLPVLLIAVVLIVGGCEASDELHLTGRQAEPSDFNAACSPSKAVFWAEDGTVGLSYNVRCADGRDVKVDDRFPGGEPR